ncbi:MAG: hypothetical protein PSX71_03650 [bacterium]|nr:hypothetical protein [bacterium]
MKAPVSKPLLAGLLATSVLTLIALLKPETDIAVEPDLALVAEHRDSRATAESGSATPWLRTLPPQHIASLNQGFVPPAPPPPPPQIVLPPPPPPKPVAPNPSFTYLGRMMRDDRVYVFLGRGEDVEVVAVGDSVDSSWRLESVSDTGIGLRYLPLNEVRQLAMSDK